VKARVKVHGEAAPSRASIITTHERNDMREHTPNPVLVVLMALFFWAMAGSALAFWVAGTIWPDGVQGLIGALGPELVAVFATLHIPAAIAGILLWQWKRHGLSRRLRVMLEAATLYFMLSVLLGMFLSYLLVSTI
jgi:hypothetical protein